MEVKEFQVVKYYQGSPRKHVTSKQAKATV